MLHLCHNSFWDEEHHCLLGRWSVHALPQCWQHSGVVAMLRNNCSNTFIEIMLFDCGNNALLGYVLNKNMGQKVEELYPLVGGVNTAQGGNTVESVCGALPQSPEEETRDLSHGPHGSLEKDNSKIYLLSVVTQDLVCFFSSIVALQYKC